MQMGFPSKLTDYTAAGLPLLVWGPKYCSAVRWASEYSGAAEVVDTTDKERLEAAVSRLAGDSKYRQQLGDRAAEAGRECFSHAKVVEVFYNGVRRSDSKSEFCGG